MGVLEEAVGIAEADHVLDPGATLGEETVMEDHQCLKESDTLVTGSIHLQANALVYSV